MKGRPQKPTEQHIAEGTYRKDRHGESPEVVPFPRSDVARPVFASNSAAELWDVWIEELFWMDKANLVVLEETCRWYGYLRDVQRVLDVKPLDKEARIAAKTYWDSFEKGASILGVPPSIRRLVAGEKPKPQGVRRRQG